MVDVHPPHGPIHGWRDFLVHLVTITIGIVIALGLEGCVEWLHHRHLVHEAQASLHAEIAGNARGIGEALAKLHEQQKALKADVDVLKHLIKDRKLPEHSSLTVDFRVSTQSDVSWRTAQSTGAVSYMPYAEAKGYAEIYATQAQLYASEQQAARDAILALAPFVDATDADPDPTPEEGAAYLQKVQALEGQLLLVDALMKALDAQYKAYLGIHPAD